jgi:hypothetical protein
LGPFHFPLSLPSFFPLNNNNNSGVPTPLVVWGSFYSLSSLLIIIIYKSIHYSTNPSINQHFKMSNDSIQPNDDGDGDDDLLVAVTAPASPAEVTNEVSSSPRNMSSRTSPRTSSPTPSQSYFARYCLTFPPASWLALYNLKTDLATDLIAGIFLSAIVIPQSMAYASMAGLNPVIGLYSSLIPAIIYSLLGTSKHMSFGMCTALS